MGITYGDHLIDSGHYELTPEQEREIDVREDEKLREETLRTKIEEVLRKFHRNACYPEADDMETSLAADAIDRLYTALNPPPAELRNPFEK